MADFEPLLVNPAELRPLPEGMRGVACGFCDKAQAVWERTSYVGQQEPGLFMCSLCWLYASPWAEDRAEDIGAYVSEIEKHQGKLYKKTEDAKLADCLEADGILGALVLSSRLFFVAGKRARG